MQRLHPSRRYRTAAIAVLAPFFLLPAYTNAQDGGAPQVAPAPEGSVGGMGDINLYPKRVVINGRREIATIGLYNKTSNEGDYEIELQDTMMTPEGRLINFNDGLSDADKAKVRTASGILRYSPRRVTLRANESQTIRMMARATNELPDGEYRSHFLALSVPREGSGGLSIDNAVGGTEGNAIGVTIRPRFGISIPVIVRIGETTLDVSLTDPQLLTLPDGSRAIGITINRSGTRSAFGDFVVTAKGAPEPVSISRGIGVYPEIDHRKVLLPIDPETEARFLAAGTELTITYTDDDYEPGAQLAETNLVIR
jgi:hypothetical protein